MRTFLTQVTIFSGPYNLLAYAVWRYLLPVTHFCTHTYRH